MVQRQLELLLLAGKAEEVERRLRLPVADDRRGAAELEAERLVEGAARVRIGDANHCVEIARCHVLILPGLRGAARRAPHPATPHGADTRGASRPRTRLARNA